MSDTLSGIAKQIHLSAEIAGKLSALAKQRHISEDRIVERALDILFNLTDLLDEPGEQNAWASLSEQALLRVWDNDEDAVYDKWQETYGA